MSTVLHKQRTTGRGVVDFATAIKPTPAAREYDWRDDALCTQTDPDAFFPETGETASPAKKVCDSCKVAEQCLEYALANDEAFGVWGGLSAKERRRLVKKAAKELAEQKAA